MTTQFRGYPTVPLTPTVADGRTQINDLAAAVDADVAALAAGYRLTAIVWITSSGSFAKSTYAGIRAVDVETVGGGGGSGSAAATSAAQKSIGVGGGGGSYARKFLLASSLAASETVTVGAGGTAGTAGGNGGAGGTTQFGTSALCKAVGGLGGNGGALLASTGATGGSAGGAGGTGSSGVGDLTVDGDDAPIAFWYNSDIHYGELAGARSGGPYGAITMPTGIFSSFAGRAGRGFGSGASGAYNNVSQSARNGAAGSAGLIVVRVYV